MKLLIFLTGVQNIIDNCPNIYNDDQTDSDRDGVGDVCDNCPSKVNSQQVGSVFEGKKCYIFSIECTL